MRTQIGGEVGRNWEELREGNCNQNLLQEKSRFSERKMRKKRNAAPPQRQVTEKIKETGENLQVQLCFSASVHWESTGLRTHTVKSASLQIAKCCGGKKNNINFGEWNEIENPMERLGDKECPFLGPRPFLQWWNLPDSPSPVPHHRLQWRSLTLEDKGYLIALRTGD